ncbi:MAG: hypothetical protein ACI4B8_01290 [Candidatus Gastranaerophilaceae bacterium]
MTKKLTALFLVFIMSFFNTCYAANWVTITAENGKQADLDLDSVKMALETVEYDIRIEQGGVYYLNRFSSELYKDNTPTAVIMRGKYENGVLVNRENVERKWKPLKQGTLQAEIFDVLSKELDEKSFNKGQDTMDKYLKKQKKNILRQWNPKARKFKYYDKSHIRKDSYTPVYSNDFAFTIDNNGTISNRASSDNSNMLLDVRSLDALPNGYTDETFKLNVNVKYYKYVGCSKENRKPIVKQSPVEASVAVGKNSRPPVLGHIQYGLLYSYKKTTGIGSTLLSDKDFPFIVDLVYFPVALAGSIVIPVSGWLLFGILFPLSGGDFVDLGD